MNTYSITFRNANGDLRSNYFEFKSKTTDEARDCFDDLFGLKSLSVANIKDI